MPGDFTACDGLIERAVEAENLGFDSVWLPQVSGIDALMVLALAGGKTSHIELGTAVVPTYPRHPTVLAAQALTVQDATNGRLALGIGLSHRMVIEGAFGLDYSKPIPHTREYLTVLNELLDGARVSHEGELYRVHWQTTVPGAKRPPVLVAALGPAMLKLCGALADGTVTWMGGVDYLRDVAVPTMTAAASAAGRAAPRFVCMVPTLLTNDVAGGKRLIEETYQMYGQIPSYRATLDRGGAGGPSDVAVLGSKEDLEAGLRAYETVGVTDFVAVIPPSAGADAEATRQFIGSLA
jgi:F420-dependent oxidoreductase-like protein